MVGASVALTVLALAVPVPYVGLAAVVALGGLGLAYIGWSEQFLTQYSNDLRAARAGTLSGGFVRAEMASPVGLNRDADTPRSPSPHSRRRSRGPSR